MSLSDAEKKLYGWKSEEGQEKKPVVNLKDGEAVNLKNTWSDPDKSTPIYEGKTTADKVGIFAKTGFWIILLALLVTGGFGYYFISQYNKTKDLDFNASAPSKVMLAQPFDISINIENKAQSALKQPEILIKLPEGMVIIDGNLNRQIVQDVLDDIESGGQVKKSYKAVILKGEQSVKKADIVFTYLPPNLNTRFEKKESLEVTAEQTSISLNVSAPQVVFNGEAFDISVNYKNLSGFEFSKARIQLIYPSNFIYRSSTATTTVSNNIWSLENITPGTENTFSIKGFLNGPDQSFHDIKSQLYLTFNNEEYLITEKSASLSIASSPLSLFITANNTPNYISRAGDSIQYQLSYRNNTNVGLSDAIMKVKLSGEMFDFTSLNTNGHFDSINNTITWNASNAPELKLLASGAQGSASFSINTKADYPIRRLFDKNFILKAQAEINSPTVPMEISSDKTVGLANLETKVGGKIFMDTFYERVSGPNPPQANKATVYNVHWTIKNYSTDVKEVKVRGTLKAGTIWTNVVKSNIDSIPVYNERTGEIAWDISRITATKGVIGSPVEATFQIKVTPNITEISQALVLVNESSVRAIDEFTNLELNSRVEALGTSETVRP